MNISIIVCFSILVALMIVLIANNCFQYDSSEETMIERICCCCPFIPRYFNKQRNESKKNYHKNMLQVNH